MELFTLLAKLTLDSSAFDSKLNEARSAGKSFQGPEDVSLDMNTDRFEAALADAEQAAAGFTGPKTPSLDLDSTDFDTDLANAETNAENFDGPDEQDLDLDKTDFDTDLTDAQTDSDNFTGPEDPSLDLDTKDFDESLSGAQTDADSFTGPEDATLDLDASGFDDSLDDAQTDADNFTGPEDQSLDLDTSEFNASIAGAESSAESLETNLDGTWKKIAAGITAAGVIATINKVKDAISEAVNIAARLGDDADKGSRRLGISAEAYQEWGHALSQSGANINDFSRGILSMNQVLSGGKASDDFTNAMVELGVSTNDANGKIKDTATFLKDTVKALADFKGTSAERGALVQAIFGKSGNNLNALFDSGSEGIQDLIDEAHSLGLVMSDEEIANSVAYGDALANMNAAIEGLKTSLVTGLMPELTKTLEFVTSIVTMFNGRTDNSLETQLTGVDEGLAATATDAKETARTATGLLGKLWEMGDATKLTADQQAVWHETAKKLVELIPDLSDKVKLDTLELTGNKEELQGIIDKWQELTTARALQSAMAKRQQLVAEAAEKQTDAQVAATLREIEAENKRQDAIEKVNKLLEAQGMEKLGENASREEIEKAQNLMDLYYGTSGYNEDYTNALLATSELTGTAEEAEKAREEADKLTTELDLVRESTQAWMDAAKIAYLGTTENADSAIEEVAALEAEVQALAAQSAVEIDVSTKPLISGFGHAKGANIIPYDDYPALLHRDEAVLTASEARKWRSGESGDSFNAAAMEDAIVSAIRKGMEGATVEAYMDGKRVTQQVNRQNTSDLQSRRYAP